MILRLPDPRLRGILAAAALLIALWLAFFGVRAAIARHGSEGETTKRLETAVRLEPGNPAYWYALGRYQQYNLEEPDPAKAEQSYRKAIALNPVDTDAWLDLATGYELEGRTDEARQAYLQAKKSYPVSADVSWRYGNFLLRDGKQAEAYAELRRAIDADPHRAAAAFSRAYRTNPNMDELFEQLLPVKKSVYVDVIWEALASKQFAVAKAAWARLMKLQPQLTVRDVDHFVAELLTEGEFNEARQVWDQGAATMKLPSRLQPQSSVVWDPSFETDISGTAFTWRYSPFTKGMSVRLDKGEKLSGNQSLRLSFDGEHNANQEAACTLAVVQPKTTYRFSGWIKTSGITSDQGIGFRLMPNGATPIPYVNTQRIAGTNGWTLVEQTWTPGPDVYRVTICVVRDISDDPDGRIAGTAWVDDVNLLPQPAEHRKP